MAFFAVVFADNNSDFNYFWLGALIDYIGRKHWNLRLDSDGQVHLNS